MAVKSDRRVIIELSAEVGELRKGLEQAKKEIMKFQDNVNKNTLNIGKAFKLIAGYIAFNKIAKEVKASVENFAQMQGVALKLQNVFPTFQNEIMAWANSFYKATGIAKTNLIGLANEIGDLAIGLGMGEEPATKLSTSLTQLAYDLAYANRGSVTLEDATRDILSALVGEYEAIKKLGVAMNETTLKQAMLELGLEGTFQQLSESEKILVRYAVMWKQSQLSMGMATRMTDSVIGWQERLKSALEDTRRALGSSVAPAYMMFAKIMTGLVLPTIQIVSNAFSSFFQSINNSGAGLYVMVGVLSLLAGILAYSLFPSISKVIGAVWTSLSLIMMEINVNGVASVVKSKLTVVNTALANSYAKLTFVIGSVIFSALIMLSVFKGLNKALNKQQKVTKAWIDPKELLKLVNKDKKIMNSGIKDIDKNANKRKKIEKRINDELKRLFNERVQQYSNMEDFLKGVDRKVIGMNNILKGARSSTLAIQEFNKAIDVLSKRLKTPEEVAFLNELKQLDPNEYSGYVKAIAGATDEQLKEIVKLWQIRHKEAVKKAGEEIKIQAPEIKNNIMNNLTLDETQLNKQGQIIGDNIVEAIGGAFSNESTQKLLSQMIGNGITESLKDVKDSIINTFKGTTAGAIVGGIAGALLVSIVGYPEFAKIGAKIGAMIGGAIGGGISLNWEEIKAKFTPMYKTVKTALEVVDWGLISTGIVTEITQPFAGIPRIIAGFLSAKNIQPYIDNLKTSFKSAVANSLNPALATLNSLFSTVNKVLNATIYIPFKGNVKVGGGLQLPQLQLFANGGVVDKATLGIFGEAGTEALIPLSNPSKMKPFAQAVAQYLGNNQGSVVVNLYGTTIREEADIEKLAQRLYDLSRRNGRAIGVR